MSPILIWSRIFDNNQPGILYVIFYYQVNSTRQVQSTMTSLTSVLSFLLILLISFAPIQLLSYPILKKVK